MYVGVFGILVLFVHQYRNKHQYLCSSDLRSVNRYRCPKRTYNRVWDFNKKSRFSVQKINSKWIFFYRQEVTLQDVAQFLGHSFPLFLILKHRLVLHWLVKSMPAWVHKCPKKLKRDVQNSELLLYFAFHFVANDIICNINRVKKKGILLVDPTVFV